MHLIILAKVRVMRAAHIILAHILALQLVDAGFVAGAVGVIWGVEAAEKGGCAAGRAAGWAVRRFLDLILRLARSRGWSCSETW